MKDKWKYIGIDVFVGDYIIIGDIVFVMNGFQNIVKNRIVNGVNCSCLYGFVYWLFIVVQ